MMQKTIAFLLPYVAVGAGLFVFHSAWLAILSYHIGIIAIICSSKKRIPVERLFKSRNHKTPVIMAAVGVVGGILLYLLWPFLEMPGQISGYLRSIGLTARAWPLFIVYFVLVNALLEEYFWRGFLANGSRGATLNDLFFSGYHALVLVGAIGTAWVAAIFLIISFVAWSWRQVNRLNEGLLPSVAGHVAADVSVMLAAYLRMR